VVSPPIKPPRSAKKKERLWHSSRF
jgi:hypothetical protein